ncbi:MAG: metal ABC transporter permease [Betaproteobacteria bacterium]|nr:metal ABC transporter permease [Betaproteobacteria bacterium]
MDGVVELGSVLAAPSLAGLLVLASHVPLGEQVLRRGIVFIDLAIAQIAALGVLLTAGWGNGPFSAWWMSTAAALAGAGLVAWLARAWPEQREALIGLVYVGGAAAAVLWVSSDPHGAQKLRALLAGDILWVGADSLWLLAVGTALFTALAFRHPTALNRDIVFYPAFAILVSLSVPVLGLYLVFTALIAPALGVHRLRQAGHPRARGAAYLIGVIGLLMGLTGSYLLDTPSGPAIVLALIATAAVSSALAAVRLRG